MNRSFCQSKAGNFKEEDLFRTILNETETIVQGSDCNALKILYINRRAAEFAGRGWVALGGMRCCEYRMHSDRVCAVCDLRHLAGAASKKSVQTIPIIAMSANVFDDDVEKSHTAGMNAHLSKPIERQLLYRVLSEVMNRE